MLAFSSHHFQLVADLLIHFFDHILTTVSVRFQIRKLETAREENAIGLVVKNLNREFFFRRPIGSRSTWRIRCGCRTVLGLPSNGFASFEIFEIVRMIVVTRATSGPRRIWPRIAAIFVASIVTTAAAEIPVAAIVTAAATLSAATAAAAPTLSSASYSPTTSTAAAFATGCTWFGPDRAFFAARFSLVFAFANRF